MKSALQRGMNFAIVPSVVGSPLSNVRRSRCSFEFGKLEPCTHVRCCCARSTTSMIVQVVVNAPTAVVDF